MPNARPTVPHKRNLDCRGDVVKKVTTNAIKQEIYDLWLGGATTYCGATASKFDRN